MFEGELITPEERPRISIPRYNETSGYDYVHDLFFFQAEDGIRYLTVTGVQTCALPISQMGQLIHEELSRKIIGAAMDVLNKMKPGLDENLYERALLIELRRRGHAVESQKEDRKSVV